MSEPRQLALEVLYELELSPGNEPPSDLHTKAARIVDGVRRHRNDIDGRIERASEHWRLSRMPIVDATVLRIGTYELVYEATPVAVVINEAVELAKAFSTEASGGFVNGLLAGIAQEVRPIAPDDV